MSPSRLPKPIRRVFFARASAIGTAAILGLPRIAAAEPPPEITKIRLVHGPFLCYAPQYLSDERCEKFIGGY